MVAHGVFGYSPFLGGERPDDLPAHMDGSLRAHLRAPSGSERVMLHRCYSCV